MAIYFGEIYLYSLNPSKLFSFLSFLLDIEAKEISDDFISFNFQNMLFKIIRSDKKRIDKTKYFTLCVTNLNELIEIKQNIEFYHYKEGDSKFQLVQSEDSLEFSDPDGRKWEVNYQIDKYIKPEKADINLTL